VVSGISPVVVTRQDLAVAIYLVEFYSPRGSAPATERLTGAAATAGRSLQHLWTILVPVDEIAFCLVEAPSAAIVAGLADAAGLEPERIVEALAYDEGGVCGHDGDHKRARLRAVKEER
jgi:hypothetical protein